MIIQAMPSTGSQPADEAQDQNSGGRACMCWRTKALMPAA
jgi:hypothetical protein